MKLLFSTFMIAFFAIMTSFTTNPELQTFPSIDIKTLSGEKVNTDEYIGNGNITVVSFWASWCSPCKRELDAFTDFYDEWKADGVDVIAITIDDSRGLAKIPGIIASKNWDYTVLSDAKQELQRALAFETIPQTYIVDGDGNIIYSHNGYNPGDEYELDDHIKAALK